MAGHEIRCFADVLGCSEDRIEVFDLLRACPTVSELDHIDVVLIGGSGDYSVAGGGPWLTPALEAMRELHELRKPTFASCWGFQAMARALGGVVVNDLSRAEVGTHAVRLTDAGRADPVFGPLAEAGETFPAQMGHQDIVDRLPDGAVRLASTDLVENQAFAFPGRPIYGTQFHPELTRRTLLDRLEHYPAYVERIAGVPFERFRREGVFESPETARMLPRFLETIGIRR